MTAAAPSAPPVPPVPPVPSDGAVSPAGVGAAGAGGGGDEDARLAEDAVAFCSRLVRFDTSNFGGGESRGERAAAEWVAGVLAECGYAPQVLESAPGRASTVVRIPGADPAAPALL